MNRHLWKHFNKKAREKLRIKQLGGHDVHVVEGDNPKSLALLARAYAEVYQKAFLIPEEQESLASMVQSLKNGTAIISIAGSDLDTDHPTLKGLVVGYYYPDQAVGLLGYIATAPAFQGQGLGRAMNEANNLALLDIAAARKQPLGGIFLECNLPTTQNDVMDPVKRIAMYEKWGCVTLPIFYKQPALEKGGAGVELKLLAEPHPATGAYPSKDAIKAFLTGIYKVSERDAGTPPPEKNPDYLRSIKELEALDLKAFYAAAKAGKTPPAPPPPKP